MEKNSSSIFLRSWKKRVNCEKLNLIYKDHKEASNIETASICEIVEAVRAKLNWSQSKFMAVLILRERISFKRNSGSEMCIFKMSGWKWKYLKTILLYDEEHIKVLQMPVAESKIFMKMFQIKEELLDTALKDAPKVGARANST